MLAQMGPHVVLASLIIVWTFPIWPILLPLGFVTVVVLFVILLELFDLAKIKSGQVPISVVVFVVTVIACGLALFRALHAPYFQERDRYLARFQSIPGLENVRVEGAERYNRMLCAG